MRLAVLLVSLCIWPASADEASDRAAIEKTIAAVTARPFYSKLVTPDFRRAEIAQLGVIVKPIVVDDPPDRVYISTEPWGEATWGYRVNVKQLNGSMTPLGFQFLTPDVALVDAVLDRGTAETVPLLIVMKQHNGDWRIASIRRMAAAK